jgi:hypothetical protein
MLTGERIGRDDVAALGAGGLVTTAGEDE